MSNPLPFGAWLKQRRRTLDLTQQSLADRAHCSIVTIRKIESSDLTPSKQLAQQLAAALQISETDQAAFIQFARSRDAQMPVDAFSAASEAVATPVSQEFRVPASLNTLIGREWEINAGCDLLRRKGVRLVTLTGPPGTGKTRLSLAMGERLQNEMRHGVCCVLLAAIRDPALVLTAIAQALGVSEAAKRSLLDETQAYLSNKHLLLVLDNFEQVLEAAAIVSQLLEAAPQVKALISSRETLKIYGEHEFPVPPLTVPRIDEEISVPELGMYSAIDLFVQRAQAAQPKFVLTDDNARTLIRICARLDGLPLAIEMAAARIKWSAPAALLEQLNQHLSALSGHTRDHTPRQQTLRGAIDWSYELLDENERGVFDRCGVFAGGFDVAAMDAIAGNRNTEPVLHALIEKSLLTHRINEEGVARYTLLEVMREYAHDRLVAQHTLDQARRAHAEYYLAIAEQSARAFGGMEEKQALDRLEREHNNLRAALQWALEQADVQDLLRLCDALGSFWIVRGYWSDGQYWINQALARIKAADSDNYQRLHANVLSLAAQLAENSGHSSVMRAFYEESLRLRRALGDQAAIAKSLSGLGQVASNEGDFANARTYLTDSIAILRALDDRSGLAVSLHALGYVAHVQGHIGEARKLCEESLILRRASGDQLGVAATLNSLGYIAAAQRAYEQARQFYEESLDLRSAFGDKAGVASTLNNLGVVASEQEDYAAAQKFYAESLALRHALGDERGIAVGIINLGNVAYNLEDWESARAHYMDALAKLEVLNDQRAIAIALNSLGNVALILGDIAAAGRYHQQSLTRRHALGDRAGIIHALAGLAGWLAASGQIERAVQVFSALNGEQVEPGWRLDKQEQRIYDETLDTARAQLGESKFDAAWVQGLTRSIEETVAYALAE